MLHTQSFFCYLKPCYCYYSGYMPTTSSYTSRRLQVLLWPDMLFCSLWRESDLRVAMSCVLGTAPVSDTMLDVHHHTTSGSLHSAPCFCTVRVVASSSPPDYPWPGFVYQQSWRFFVQQLQRQARDTAKGRRRGAGGGQGLPAGFGRSTRVERAAQRRASATTGRK